MASLLDRTFGLLSRHNYSEAELRRKLAVPPIARRRFRERTDAQPSTAVSQVEIDQAIAYCHDHDWLDNGLFARRYVSRRSGEKVRAAAAKPQTKIKVQRYLLSRGFSFDEKPVYIIQIYK